MASIDENTLLGNLDPNMTLGELVGEMRKQGIMSNSRFDRERETFVGKIKESFKEIDGAVMHMAEPWAKVDAAAAKYARTIASTKKGLEELRRSSIRNVHVGNIGFEFNMNAQELIEAQTNYMKGIGRNVKLGLDDQKTLAAITSVYGDSAEMFNAFDRMGVTMEGVGTHMGKMYSEAAKNGISLEKYANNVKQGLEMANRYTFRDGLKGMEAMAKRAAAIRMDMQQVQSFAGAFDNVENALSNAAKLQVLGGQFSMGADALGLLNDSLNDLEGLQKRMENFTNGMGTLNKQTGEVEISTFNRLRLQQYAKVTGQDEGKVMEVARRQAMRGEIEAAINSSKNGAIDEDFRELLKNTATFKGGKAGVTIDGEFKEISKLTAKDQEALIAESRTQTEDIKQIAKDVRSLLDMREGVKKQYENLKARTTSRWVGSTAKGATSWVAGGWLAGITKNLVFPIMAIVGAVGTVAATFKGLKRIWSVGEGGSVTSSSRIKRVFKRGGDVTSKASKSATKATSALGKKGATEAAEAVAKKGATRHVTTNIAERGIKKVGLKIGGKKGVEIAGKLATGAAKGAGIGIIGAAGNIATDYLVEKGKMKAGGGAHMAMKAGSSALEGAAMASIVAPFFGPAAPLVVAMGALGGAVVGATKVQKVRNEKIVDSQLEKLGIARNGNYGVGRLSEIDKALQTGKMSNSLRKKLLREGDADIVNQINAVKQQKKAEKEAKREKRQERRDKRREEIKQKIGVANFSVEHANFSGLGDGFGVSKLAKLNPLSKLSPTPLLRAAKKEDGSSPELKTFEALKKAGKFAANLAEKRVENTERLKVDINGTIKLETPKGEQFDIMKEIKRNPKLLDELTQAIIKSMNTQQYGGYRTDRTFGNNPPRN